jgi:hypothetical protein
MKENIPLTTHTHTLNFLSYTVLLLLIFHSQFSFGGKNIYFMLVTSDNRYKIFLSSAVCVCVCFRHI